MKIGKWQCSEGHIFPWGDEDWHRNNEYSQYFAPEWDCWVPRYCQADFEDGGPCMDSTSLILMDHLMED